MSLTFSTGFDYWNERMKMEKTGEWLTRGDLTRKFYRPKQASVRIPSAG